MQNLKVAVCLDPDAPEFDAALQRNPSLLTRAIMVRWQNLEPSEQHTAVTAAFAAVSEHGAPDGKPAVQVAGHVCKAVSQWLQDMHAIAARGAAVTPGHLSAAVQQCVHLYSVKLTEITTNVDFLQARPH